VEDNMQIFIGEYVIYFGVEKTTKGIEHKIKQYFDALGLSHGLHPEWSAITLKIERIKSLRVYHNPALVHKICPVEKQNGAEYVGLVEAKYVVELLYPEGV
jgi:hypothetical protein